MRYQCNGITLDMTPDDLLRMTDDETQKCLVFSELQTIILLEELEQEEEGAIHIIEGYTAMLEYSGVTFDTLDVDEEG